MPSIKTHVFILPLLLSLQCYSLVEARFRDSTPLFQDSFHVRSLDSNEFERVRNSTDEVWVVDFYAPWCPHCRQFAPELERVAAFYAESRTVKIGAVDCTLHHDPCDIEGIREFPAIYLYHAPPDATEPRPLKGYHVRNTKGVINWVEKAMTDAGLSSGIPTDNLIERISALQRDRVKQVAENNYNADAAGSPGASDKLRENSAQMKQARLHDAGAAAIFSLESGLFTGTQLLEGERYDAAVAWVRAIAGCFPLEQNRKVFSSLAQLLESRPQWRKADWENAVTLWKQEHATETFPQTIMTPSERQTWKHCNTFTCGLWSLFHALSSQSKSYPPSELANSIRSFVTNFFACEECVKHFLQANPPKVMRELAKSDKFGPEAVVVWLWRMHNKVNRVTRKRIWPSMTDCSICYSESVLEPSLEDAAFHPDEITNFIISVYGEPANDKFGETLGASTSFMSSFGASAMVLVVFVLLVACALRLVRSQNMKMADWKQAFEREHSA